MNMQFFRLAGLAFLAAILFTETGRTQGAASVSTNEARAIAKEAYLYGFPMVEGYKTLYAQAVEQSGPNFKAPFNQIGNTANVFTPKDTAIITPNSDTPYSFGVDGSARRVSTDRGRDPWPELPEFARMVSGQTA